jgi:hypothetical protein
MHTHVQFLEKNLNGDIRDACGSDGVFILDGRNNLPTFIYDARNRAKQLSRVSHFVGFSIRCGARLDNCREIYREIFEP